MAKAGPVDAYIASRPECVQPALAKVRRAISKAVPRAQEVISYGIPAYCLDGRIVVFFAGWNEHYSLYPGDARTVGALKAELSRYKVSKGTIRFPVSEPVPVRLIERIAKLRAKEVETGARAGYASSTAAKKKKKKKLSKRAAA